MVDEVVDPRPTGCVCNYQLKKTEEIYTSNFLVVYSPQVCGCNTILLLSMAPEEMNTLIICIANFLLQIKAMKDMYLPEISEMYQKIDAKLQQVCYTFKFPFAIHRLSLFIIQPFPFILMVEISVGCPHVTVNTPVLRNTLFTI